MTRYLILGHSGGKQWLEITEIEARSGTSAIREYLNGIEPVDETWRERYNAVPARSWRPVNVTVKTKTSLKFDATPTSS